MLYTVQTELEIFCHAFIPYQKRIPNPVKHKLQKAPSMFDKVLDAPLLLLSKVAKPLQAIELIELFLIPLVPKRSKFW